MCKYFQGGLTMRDYAIGLDVGIASVGWAIVALDENSRPCGIIDFGSRIFNAAEHPKTGASLALPRREARSSRRRLRRHRHRNERIRNLLLATEVITEDQLIHLFDGQLEDIYKLRVKALDEPVSASEFARILLHISQRRGFKSNRKNPSNKEDGKLLEAVNQNKDRMTACGYRTVGEMYLKDEAFAQFKRNKGGKYLTTVTRDMVEDEVHRIFAAQRALQRTFASEQLERAYLDILLGQRSFDEGPGAGPYAGNQIERMIGKCTFEDEQRAAKATYSFEYFTLLEKVNHIRLCTTSSSVPLTADQRSLLIKEAHKTENLDYSRIRKLLLLSDQQTFNTVRYEKDATIEACEKKTKFSHLKAYHKMRVALDRISKGYSSQLSLDQKNQIGKIFSIYKTSAKIRPALFAIGLNEVEVDALESINSFSGFGHLSVTACQKIIPFLEQGLNYNDACQCAGYDFKAHSGAARSVYLNAQDERLESLTSPVARRSIAQTIKVINAIIRRQGGQSPTFVNIELARDLSRDHNERKKFERDMEQNRAKNEQALERIRSEFGVDSPTGQDLVMMKLYEEQGGVCPYSGKQLSLVRLFTEGNYAEVDHIMPYSISFDDSYKNKVLVLAEENRNKGNRLPLQYLTGQRRDNFIVLVNSTVRDPRKRKNLLKESFTDEDFASFKERNLQDTRTISRFLYNYINDTLLFAPSSTGRKKRVTAVNGAVTSYLRKRWGISKIRENGDLHHAVDALIVACATDGMIQQISRYAQYRECRYMQQNDGSYAIDPATGEVLRHFPYPWPDFRRELEARLSSNPTRAVLDQRIPFYIDPCEPISLRPPFVSRVPRRKVSGPAHKDTIKGLCKDDPNFVIVKRPLTDLKLDKNGEIADYYDPASDRLLYEALLSQLKKFGGNAAKAFAEPFYKPKKDGTPGPLVNKVKLMEKSTLYVPVHKGSAVAAHESMVRIDVFYVEGDGYYFVPIYVADTLRPELPNKACVAHKSYSSWKEMCPDDFVFSLYPNDLIKVSHRRGFNLALQNKASSLPRERTENSAFLYFVSADIAGAQLSAITHDGTYGTRLGIKTLDKLEKYTVDVLGEYHLVSHEPRQPFCREEEV